jgi:multimeric flavodoxin WrbA
VPAASPLSAFAINCSLKSSEASEKSSTDKLVGDMFDAMRPYGVTGEVVRGADFDIKPGVLSDEGAGDEWPELRKRILKADIFILATPIWLGQPSSIAKRVLERMDAFLSETDSASRMPRQARWPLRRSSETKTARIIAMPRCSRR